MAHDETELAAWQPLREGRVPDAAALRELRGQLHAAGPTLWNEPLATLWRQARPTVRAQALREMLEGGQPGPLLVEALLQSVEAGDIDSSNAALHVLGESAQVQLATAGWRRIARVARRERGLVLPDREAALLVARHGPASALPTVLLTALRDGPEDADDRLGALASLGRFDDARAVQLVARVLATGAAGLEGLQAVATAVARGGDPDDWVAGLQAAVGLDIDAWVRWSALDGLSRMQPAAVVLPWVLAAWRAAGEDLPDWYLPFCEQRARDLKPGLDLHKAASGNVKLAPLPGLAGRVLSRCPRVARAAMVEWRQQHGDDDALVAQRAALEVSLVQRGQLLGSFVARTDTKAAPLGESWRPWSRVLTAAERATLEVEETAWLDGAT